MYSTLSTLNTTTAVPLSKAPNPQLLPGRRSINGCPLLRVCVHGVCVQCCVCVHFGWVKCRAQIPSMGHHTWPYVTSLSLSLSLSKDRVLTDTVWIFIKNKVHSLFPNDGIRRKAMQRLFFHNLGLHRILLSLEQFLSFVFCVDLCVCLSHKHYMCESVGGAKQAAM